MTRITTYTCDHCGKAVTSTTGYPGGWTMSFAGDGGDYCSRDCLYPTPSTGRTEPDTRETDRRETEDYPGLVVHTGRQSGSITAGHSRLPLWAFVSQAIVYGWEPEVTAYDPEQYGWTKDKMGEFLHHLLQNRDEFGRLICVLADVERRAEARGNTAWLERPRSVKRVREALRRCMGTLEGERG